MWKYILNRLLQIVITMLVFLTLQFFILDAQPGDITLQYVMNPKFTPEQREALQKHLGLDKPPMYRFLKWMGNTLQGDLGVSYSYSPRTVMEIIQERAPRTVFLFLTATMIQFFIGFWMGKILAWQRGSFVEYSSTIVGAVLYTVFTPWFALMMIWLFGFYLKWLPLGKFLDPNLWRTVKVNSNFVFSHLMTSSTIYVLLILVTIYATRKMSPASRERSRWGIGILLTAGLVAYWSFSQYSKLTFDILYHMILPIITLTLINFAGTMLLTRTTMLETLREDYIMAARAKGLADKVVRDKHAARNALLPVFTSLVISLPFILGGGIITETIFSWPGMGLTLLQASVSGDIPMVMGAFLFIGSLALIAHLVADIMYAFLDPRIRYA
jgi:peptide/nickel transport system permease protein